MPTFEVEAMVRGYHIYQDVWNPTINQGLQCAREPGNLRDPFAVAVLTGNSHQIVGHIPLKISSLCSLFLRRGGTITCKVTGKRRHSKDLPQGGLEIPCILTFEGSSTEIAKVEKLVKRSLAFLTKENDLKDTPAEVTATVSEDSEPARKKTRIDHTRLDIETGSILNGAMLTDLHIHLAQRLLKQQFPHLNGLQPTVLQTRANLGVMTPLPNQLQVIHTRGDHWILASNIGCKDSAVNVYDSVYRSIDEATSTVITTLFQASTLKIIESQKQEGKTDCGVFAIATATALAHGVNLSTYTFLQSAMRSHLVNCFKENLMTLFPCS